MTPLFWVVIAFACLVTGISLLELNDYKKKLIEVENRNEAMTKEMECLVYAFNLAEKSRREAELQAADYAQQRDHLLQQLQHAENNNHREPGA